MTSAVSCTDCPPFFGTAPYTSIGSSDDDAIVQKYREFCAQLTTTMGGRLNHVRTELLTLAQYALSPGWDDEDALPIPHSAFQRVIDLMIMLPNNLPLPEFDADPRGAISLEWRRDRSHLLEISIDGRNTIGYAGIFGSRDDRDYGYKPLREDGVAELVRLICRVGFTA